MNDSTERKISDGSAICDTIWTFISMVIEIAPTNPVIKIEAIRAESFFFLREEVIGNKITPNPTNKIGTNSQNEVTLESNPVNTNKDMTIRRQA